MCGIAFARLLAVYSVLWFVGMYWRCREFRPALGSLRGFSGEWLFMPVGSFRLRASAGVTTLIPICSSVSLGHLRLENIPYLLLLAAEAPPAGGPG